MHIDTVPAGSAWTGDPHKLRDVGDKLIGLGTCDIKGAAACILAALGEVKPQNVAVLFSGDEEMGSEVMPYVIKNTDIKFIPKAIVCEPTSCTMGVRHRGMLAFNARFEGPGGHSSLADITQAPLQRIIRFANALSDYGDSFKDIGDAAYKGLCLNIGRISTDGHMNVIPTEATLDFSLRPPPGDDVTRHSAAVYEIWNKGFKDGVLSQRVMQPALNKGNLTELSIIFAGYDPIDLPYWTEAAQLGAAGINVVVFGPGHVDQAHKPDEFVKVNELIAATELYSRALIA